MIKFLNRWSRKLHRWGAVVIAVPVLVVILSGLLLQVKKQVAWVQPPTQRGVGGQPWIGWERVLASAGSVKQAEITTWDDIDRLDVRPERGIVKVQSLNRWEVQLDLATGEVLSAQLRRSDLIESLHDGSWFGDPAKLWVFLPSGMILFGLWLSGIYLWILPIQQRRINRRRRRYIAELEASASRKTEGLT